MVRAHDGRKNTKIQRIESGDLGASLRRCHSRFSKIWPGNQNLEGLFKLPHTDTTYVRCDWSSWKDVVAVALPALELEQVPHCNSILSLLQTRTDVLSITVKPVEERGRLGERERGKNSETRTWLG
eukprot:scpid18794/ scgid15948/ 